MDRHSCPFYDTTGVPWTDNILVPKFIWGYGGNYKTWALKNQSGVHFRGRSLPWCGAVPFHPAYLPMSPVNMRATARHFSGI